MGGREGRCVQRPHSFSVFRFHLSVCYMQLAVPNVVAMAVRMVITMLRILPQVLLLLKVPIVISLRFKV